MFWGLVFGVFLGWCWSHAWSLFLYVWSYFVFACSFFISLYILWKKNSFLSFFSRKINFFGKSFFFGPFSFEKVFENIWDPRGSTHRSEICRWVQFQLWGRDGSKVMAGQNGDQNSVTDRSRI